MSINRTKQIGLVLLLIAAILPVAIAAKEKAAGGTNMSRYLIISPHTAEECLAALDDIAAKGKDELAKWDWGCGTGDHTGYCVVEAASKDAALMMVPQAERAKAKVIGLNKFTIEQIKSFHEAHKNH